jgi:hypothetical protein
VKLTPYQRLAETLLDIDLPEWILDQANEAVPAEVVARKLAERTNNAVDVSGQTIRNWTAQFREARDQAGVA